MGSKTSIYLSTKAMAYKEIEPCARALGMQVLILDPKSYRQNDKLAQKFRSLGIADSEYERIESELEDQQAIVILKSKKYYGAPEIAPYFAKFDLDSESIHYMRSVNADKHSTWGDLDATIPPNKRIFLYWIRLDVLDENNDPALEENILKKKDENMKTRYSKKKILEAINHWKKELKKLDESGSSPVDCKKMWSEFADLFFQTNGHCDVAFAVDGKVCKLIAILGNQDGFDVKLSRLPDFKYESIPAKEFINELGSNGLTASKITSINANLEGKGYSLVKYSTTSGKTGRGFLLDFGDAEFSGFFFNEGEDNPDDAKADDLFIKGDKYEEEMKEQAKLAKEEAKKIKGIKDAKTFLDKNKDKIAEVSKKLKGKEKENFDEIVQFVRDNSEKVEESSKKSTSNTILLGLLFGCVGVISFLLHLNTIGWIALSPIIGPLLMGTIKKISKLDEQDEKQLDEASYEEGRIYRQSLEEISRYLTPIVEKTLKDHEVAGAIKPVDGNWIDLLNAACALAYHVQNNCPDKSLCEMAEQIVQLGAGYMI